MNLIYPAVFHSEDNAYWVEFPDLEGCHSYGDTIRDTLLNAKEALEGYAITILESGQALPKASDIHDIKASDDSFISFVECTLSSTFTTKRSVKKTLTIPAWLNEIAEKNGVNFSLTLQNALMSQLNINH